MPLPSTPSTLAGDYGGVQQNYGGLPPQDPTTDMDASSWNQAACDVGMMTQTAWLCRASFIGYGPANAVVIAQHQALWGNTVGVIPTVVRLGVGTYTLTWPTSVVDQLGVSRTIAFNTVAAFLSGGFGKIRAELTAPNQVTVYTATVGTSTLADLGLYCRVWVC